MEGLDATLTALIEKISSLAPEVWAIMVKQANAEGASALIFGILLLIIAVSLAIYSSKTAQREEYMEFKGETVFLSGLFAVLALCVAAIVLSDGALKLYNPEYYALKSLIQLP